MVNKVILLGNVGKDPDIKNFDNNKKASFTLATSEKYKDKEGKTVQKTEWHNIVVWGKPAEIIEKYVKKGKQIYVEGKITTRSYEKDGTTNYITEIVANDFTFIGNTLNTNKTDSNENTSEFSYTPNVAVSDDLPF